MKQTFATVAAAWKADKRPYVKKSTYSIYSHFVNRHLIPDWGEVSSFDEACVQVWVNRKLAGGLGQKTMKDMVLVFKMILRFGAAMGAWDPVDLHIRYPQREGSRVCVLTREQERTLLRSVADSPDGRKLGIRLCLEAGLRIGEVCGLRWEDIDFTSGLIHVRRTLQRIYISDGEVHEYLLELGTPKTATSVRDIPIRSELRQALRVLRQRSASTDFVLTCSPRPLEPRLYRTYFKGLLARQHLPVLRFHALRHTFATRCIESGCDCKTVSVLLGHASISTTLDLYVHPSLDEKRRCVERMGRWLK